MSSDTMVTVHQGELAEAYRKERKMSRARLAEILDVDVSTVYRMEQMSVIRSLTRRKLLVGVLGIPAELMGLDGEQQQPLKTNLVLNDDRMAFFEQETAVRWDMYRTGGTTRAYRGLSVWLQEVETFTQEARGSAWHQRAHTSLSLSYQLQGSIFGDMLKHDQAHRSYKKAFWIAKELDDAELMAAVLARRGVTCIQQNSPLEAIKYLNGALRLISSRGLPGLRGYILKALSEAYAMLPQAYESARHIELAERTLEYSREVLERSHCQVNKASVIAQKGINAVLLHDYERAVALIDKSLRTYNPTFVRGRARLLAQKAEAYFGMKELDYCADTAEEAFTLADSVGSSKTIERLEALYTSLLESRWRKELRVARLGALLAMNSCRPPGYSQS